MKTIIAKKVFETRTQRFYELSEPITKGRRWKDDVDIIQEMTDPEISMIKEEYRKFIPSDGCRLVCVSDAHTHVERLVFQAFTYLDNGVVKHGRMSLNIDGKHTFSIDGGDTDSVYDDEVYLRHLGMVNKVRIMLEK